jgi:mRNA interferase RelE/StbE
MAKRYALRLTKSAEKELYQLQPKQFKQVAQKIFSLQENPLPQDSKLGLAE